ncbi:spore coat protein [Geobacillus genomosp. 3]|uniref:Spore coat protein n=1 Tax=Geobacillus genomosp. 3 TaxID=1921421 RepID=S5Z804_GEOG3|nr:spore coat protein YsxE [Geobacillus genomosp. 3]AGT32977.1 spore coat protein [Geobacillus genomosp. 3]
MTIRSETYRAVLHQYGLQPRHIEQRGKAVKVHTDRGVFALKPLDDEQEAAAIWQSLHYYGRHCPPHYGTRLRSLFAAEGGRLYYLQAWHEGETGGKEEAVRAFFRGLAHLHRATVRFVKVSEEEINAYRKQKKEEWQRERAVWEERIERYETAWYMSPFQLQCCTYFHEVMRAYWFAEEQLAAWEEAVKETKQWRIAWVHGKARLSHYVTPYWISWERAHWNSPVYDLTAAFRIHVRMFPPLGQEWIEGIDEYEKELPLSPAERAFLYSHLAEPRGFVRCLERYEAASHMERNEREHVAALLRCYMAFKNMEAVVMHLVQRDAAQPQGETDGSEAPADEGGSR